MSQESKPIDSPAHQSNEEITSQVTHNNPEEVKTSDKQAEELKKDPTIQELMAR